MPWTTHSRLLCNGYKRYKYTINISITFIKPFLLPFVAVDLASDVYLIYFFRMKDSTSKKFLICCP